MRVLLWEGDLSLVRVFCVKLYNVVEMVVMSGDVVYLGGKYVFTIVMCLVFPMCILTSCSSVLDVLGIAITSFVCV